MDKHVERLRPYGQDADTLRLLIESTTDYAIFMLDPEGYVLTWNTGAERIKGYRPQEIIGKHFSTFYPPEAIALNWPAEELERAAQDGRIEDEGWRLRKDGTRFWANVIITALRGADGTLHGFAKVTRDVTDRRADEQRIRKLTVELERKVADLAAANRDLEEKNTENESFVYSVSHDLRAPLVNLQGFSEELTLTSEELRDLLSDHAVPAEIRLRALSLIDTDMGESVDFIRGAVRHLGSIIDGLLRLSRAGRVVYRRETVDVGAVVADLLSAMHGMVSASGARVEVGELPAIMGDRDAISQVFANLLGNSLKSFDDDRPGVVEIRASGEEPPVFSVGDNGIGIPSEAQPKVFQVFQHVHLSGVRGEGMGLAIVRRVIERQGGRIWFESSPGTGTTFHFTLGPRAVEGSAGEGGAPRDE